MKVRKLKVLTKCSLTYLNATLEIPFQDLNSLSSFEFVQKDVGIGEHC